MSKKRARKSWNGGSVESAMEYARERRNEMVAQGATLCGECKGEGGTILGGVCIGCHGSGVILPPDGLTLDALPPPQGPGAGE